MKRISLPTMFVVGLIGTLCLGASEGVLPVAPQSSPSVPGTAGLVICKDPRTGEILPPPPSVFETIRGSLGDALSTSAEGLVKVASPVPNGGTMVDLKGRFQNASE
jgi:hypothetical protein